MRSRPSLPIRRRFASAANVRCGMGTMMIPSTDLDGATRHAQPRLRYRPASCPPLPPTLVLEGAAQPFLFEIRASQASVGRRPDRVSMSPKGYAVVLTSAACRRPRWWSGRPWYLATEDRAVRQSSRAPTGDVMRRPRRPGPRGTMTRSAWRREESGRLDRQRGCFPSDFERRRARGCGIRPIGMERDLREVGLVGRPRRANRALPPWRRCHAEPLEGPKHGVVVDPPAVEVAPGGVAIGN